MDLKNEKKVEPTEIEVLADGLVRIPLRAPTLPPATRTNSFLIQAEAGWLLVELGPSDEGELSRLEGAIDTYVGEQDLLGVFLTHHHPDHVRGLSWFVEHYDAPIYSGQTTKDRHNHNLDRTWHVISGAEASLFGLRFIRTDGHAPDHYSVLLPDGALVAGDIISGMGTIVVAPPDGDMQEYYRSLDRLLDLDLTSIHPAHGPGSDRPLERLEAYREHRKAREQRVLHALESSESRTVEELVKDAYSDVDERLHVFAQGNIRAYLDMLESRGDVVVESSDTHRGWRLK